MYDKVYSQCRGVFHVLIQVRVCMYLVLFCCICNTAHGFYLILAIMLLTFCILYTLCLVCYIYTQRLITCDCRLILLALCYFAENFVLRCSIVIRTSTFSLRLYFYSFTVKYRGVNFMGIDIAYFYAERER